MQVSSQLSVGCLQSLNLSLLLLNLGLLLLDFGLQLTNVGRRRRECRAMSPIEWRQGRRDRAGCRKSWTAGTRKAAVHSVQVWLEQLCRQHSIQQSLAELPVTEDGKQPGNDDFTGELQLPVPSLARPTLISSQQTGVMSKHGAGELGECGLIPMRPTRRLARETHNLHLPKQRVQVVNFIIRTPGRWLKRRDG